MADHRDPNRLAQVAADGISAVIRGNAAFRTTVCVGLTVLAITGLLVVIEVVAILTTLGDKPIPS